MTRRRFYFLLCMGLFVSILSYDLDVSAQELKETPILLGFAKQEKQELPDCLPPSIPERIPNDFDKQPGRLPQLNQKSMYWAIYSGGLSICLVIFRLANRKRENQCRGGFQ